MRDLLESLDKIEEDEYHDPLKYSWLYIQQAMEEVGISLNKRLAVHDVLERMSEERRKEMGMK